MARRSLEEFVESVNGTGHLRVEHDFGDGFVRLQTSEAERRQAIQDIRCTEDIVLELLRNARDAHAQNIYVAMAREGDKRFVTVVDDGVGIPPSMHRHVFEPRVTSKLDTNHIDKWGMHGRGMALYSISVNATSARVACSGEGLGCSIAVETDLSKLGEKTDQSSFPTFTMTEGSNVAVRGPRNIVRTSCEFALESRSSCAVYVGSPAEVAATLYAHSQRALTAVERAFCRDASQLPLAKRLATAADPDSLRDMALDMGLELSSRTARRIMDGEYAQLANILELIRIIDPNDGSKRPNKAKKKARGRTVKLDSADAEELAEAVRAVFPGIAQSYYLAPDVEPTVTSAPGRIVVTIPAVEEQ